MYYITCADVMKMNIAVTMTMEVLIAVEVSELCKK